MPKNKPLSIVLYSPYIPKHFGGGERYMFSCASHLAKKHNVSIALSSTKVISNKEKKEIQKQYEDFLQMDLSDIAWIETPIGTDVSFFQKLMWTKQFDRLIYATDGSLFLSLANRNILHIQVPFTNTMDTWKKRLKLKNWHIKNTNASFTKDVIEKYWKTNINVVHTPYVDVHEFTASRNKEKTILHVGRFFTQLHSKKQDMLAKTFKKMLKQYPKKMKGWKLVFIGSVEDYEYARSVRRMAEGFPIEVIHEAKREEVKKYFSKARIYWHATGFDEDEFLHPEKMEHFGITTLEAMASKCIPIVINKGGQKEIVEHGISGFVWNTQKGLIEKTLACIEEKVDCNNIAQKAYDRVKEYFNKQKFEQKLDEMIE